MPFHDINVGRGRLVARQSMVATVWMPGVPPADGRDCLDAWPPACRPWRVVGAGELVMPRVGITRSP